MPSLKRLFDFPYYQLENYLKDALVTKYNGEWKSTSTKEYVAQLNK